MCICSALSRAFDFKIGPLDGHMVQSSEHLKGSVSNFSVRLHSNW